MTQQFFMKLTQTGLAKLTAAQAAGTSVALSEMAIGDGNGNAVPQPTGNELALVREVFRDSLNGLYVNPNDAQMLMAELIVPAAEGGFAIREVGVLDVDGDLIAYGNFPDTYKPTPAEGSTRDMLIVAAIKVSSAANVELVIDPTIVGATRQWVISTITAAFLLPGGTTGQILAKASNADGDVEWRDVTDTFNIAVDVIRELQTAAGGQTTFTLATVTTDGVAVYVEGVRVFDFTVVDQITLQLAQAYPAGTEIAFVQNEPNEPLKLRRFVRFHTYFVGQF